jgi:hypothetical protein
VRAERGSDHSTRIYTVHVACIDGAGNVSEKCVDVRVAKDDDALNTANSGHKRDKYTLVKHELKELLKLLKRK